MSYIEVDGLKEFQRAVRQAKDKDLNKRLGQANKAIGQMVIDRLYPSVSPLAVGVGKGATVRPSASKREVILRTGGTHRSRNGASAEQTRMQPWGFKRLVPIGTPLPPRPDIQGTAERHQSDIEDAWMDATIAAFSPAFAEAKS